LSGDDKLKRADCSAQLLALLQRQRRRSWHDIVTLDESWFYFHTDHETIWLPRGATPPDRERHTIQSKKIMVTIIWNPSGFYRICALPKGAKFNADYYISEILSPLVQWRSEQAGATARKLIVHADNARPHTAKKLTEFFDSNGLQRAPHPPYSPDLAPCDF
jgi:histone-lysine N-methyltransferase SETMAR